MTGATAASRHMKGHCEVVRWKSNSLSPVQSTGSSEAAQGRLKLDKKKIFGQKGQESTGGGGLGRCLRPCETHCQEKVR